MRFIIGLALGISIATASTFAYDPTDPYGFQAQQERWNQQNERLQQQMFRDQQFLNQNQRHPC